jgi:chorismate dehydratase
LNTKPLIFEFDRLAEHADLTLDVPSRLADRLAQGDLDVALIPVIECMAQPDYRVVSDACIACRGPVLSVKLLSRVPASEIRSLALDEGSRTSAALIQILLQRRYGLQPERRGLPLDGSPEEADTDAVLLIGDRAIHTARDLFAFGWDLGAEWCRETGLPFVFAVWAARPGVEVGDIDQVLRRVRDAGVAHLEEIAAHEAHKVGLTETACLAYLRDNLHFELGSRERQGLILFHEYAKALGLVPPAPGQQGKLPITVT